jgi:8-oxo-dGTP diphosphatase
MHWSLGFVFTSDFSKVLLIHKEHPDSQKGKWNGLGGKYERDEDAYQCISREVEEESDIFIPSSSWRLVGEVHGEGWGMDILTVSYSGDPSDAKTTTDERVDWFPVAKLPKTKRNLFWLIPLCIDALQYDQIEKIDIQYTSEGRWK